MLTTPEKIEELEKLIDELKERKVFSNCANLEKFMTLEEKERVIYWGIDCTSDSIHIGHLSNIIQLFRFSEKRFKIIIVLGGSTTSIGDPSDKLKERPLLEKETIKKNCEIIENQLKFIINKDYHEIEKENGLPLFCFYQKDVVKKIYNCLNIDYEKKESEVWGKFMKTCLPNKTKNFLFLNNEEWLSKLSFFEFITKYGKLVTVNYLLGKEKIKQRINSGNGMSFSEFSYSLLQAYDFLYLNKKYKCNGQAGASDQWGNFTTGLKMIKNRNSQQEKDNSFAISFNIITDKNGKKISKSENKSNIAWMSKEKTSFSQLFDYFNNMEDNQTIDFVTKFTSLTKEKIEELKNINNPKSLRILQRILTECFFFLIHGNEGIKWIREKKIKH